MCVIGVNVAGQSLANPNTRTHNTSADRKLAYESVRMHYIQHRFQYTLFKTLSLGSSVFERVMGYITSKFNV